MEVIARSATVVALLGFQDHVLIPDGAGSAQEYSALSAVFWDLYPLFRSSDIPLPRSATQALEHCRQAWDELIDILHSMGLLNHSLGTASVGLFGPVLQFSRRLIWGKSLSRARKNYRDSVFLLRDVVMDAVTHYHLQHMRHELDHLCGWRDEDKIDITLPGKHLTGPKKVERADADSGNESATSDLSCHEKWVRAMEEDLRFTE